MPAGTEVLVVGAGVAGAATALYLARAGAKVTLLEAERPAFGASGRNPGFLFLLGKATGLPLQVARAGRAFQADLAAEIGGFDFRSCGLVAFLRDERGLSAVEGFVRTRERDGLPVTMLDREGILSRVPALDPSVVGGFFSESEAQQDTGRLVLRLVEEAKALGVRALQGRVEALKVSGGRCGGVALADGSNLLADTTVLANSIDGVRLLAPHGLTLPLTPVRYQAAETAPAPFRLDTMLAGPSLFLHLPLLLAQPSFDPAHFTDPWLRMAAGMSYTHQVAQLPNGRLQFGCAAEVEEGEAVATEEGQAPALAALRRDLPATAKLAIERRWAGIVAQAPDYLPILDPAPGIPGLALNLGHAFGNLMGAMSGQMLAVALTGGSPAYYIEPFALARFKRWLG